MDTLPAANGRAVKANAVYECLFIPGLNGKTAVLPGPQQVGKFQVNHIRFVFFRKLKKICWFHLFLLYKKAKLYLFNFTFLTDCLAAALTGPDSDAIIQVYNKDFSIAYLSGFCSFNNGANRLLNKTFIHCYLQPNLLKQVDFFPDAPIRLGIPLLLATAQSIRYRNLVHFILIKR